MYWSELGWDVVAVGCWACVTHVVEGLCWDKVS